MYIVKNALRCISRSKGRNILIGIIVLVIAVSSCLGLSIRQAAENAKQETMSTMSVTATISFDRQSAMGSMSKTSEDGEKSTVGGKGAFDRSQFAVIIGAAVGAITSVPVTNALLESQVQSGENRTQQEEQNFGRGGNMQMPDNVPDMREGGGKNPFTEVMGGAQNYITEINSATDFTVILQMLAIAVALTLIAGAASMLFIMRYEPLRILSNRD